MLSTLKVSFDFCENGIGINAGEAAVVREHALFLAVDGARTAGKVKLNAVIRILPPAHESGGRMSGTPN